MSEITLFNRWTVKKRTFWFIIGGGSLLLILLLFIGSILLSGLPFGLMGASNSYAYDNDAYYEESYPMEAPSVDGAFLGMEDKASGMSFDEAESLEADFMRTDQSASIANLSAPTERLIIKEGNVSIEVEDTRASRDVIEGLVSSLKDKGAFIVNSFETQSYDGQVPYISMVIRVPFEEFDRVLDSIADLGIEVNEKNEFSDDVTAEYVDLESRIGAITAARDRLLEIMLDADSTEDLLYAEAKLTEREAELEALKGRLQYLGESALLSRISISLSPYVYSQPIDYDWKPLNTLRNAWVDLVASLENFADFLIRFVVLVLPWILFFALIVWIVVRFFKRRAAKKTVNQTEK